jgi:non-canonical purine NTP pyrophosphatase (RdgB/HAM1 family)
MLKFITGNKGKFREISSVLQPLKIQQLEVDLDELQELDSYKIIRHKLQQAFKHQDGGFFVDDTSVYYKVLRNKLPGPFMKWFLQVLGTKGLFEITKKLGGTEAEMKTIIGYAKNRKQIYFFEGKTLGNIVKPKGLGGFGVDKIFKPQGSNKTLAELKTPGSSKFSPRFKAATKLKKYLLKSKL